MKKEKTYLLDQITEEVSKDSAFAVLSYSSISANETAQIRTSLRECGSSMVAVKSRILQKFLISVNNEIELEGHTALVSGETEKFIAAAKVLKKYSGEHKDRLKILGGRFEGAVCDALALDHIATLPTKKEIRAQLLGVLQAPQANVVSVMNNVLSCVVGCLDQKIKKFK